MFFEKPKPKNSEPQEPKFEWVRVRSSNLWRVAYDSHFEKLRVQFLSGSIYEYDNVSQSVYTSLMSASSHGKYFCANIRNSYNYRKV